MDEYRIKYSKKFVNETIVIGLTLIICSYLIMKYIVKGGLIVLFAVGILLGLFFVGKTIKFLYNGRTFIKVTDTYLKFHNGRVVQLSDIKNINTNVTGSGSSYKTQLYVETVSGAKIIIADNKNFEDNLSRIEDNIQRFMRNREEKSKVYTEDINIKFSKSYVLMKNLIYIPLALILGYVISQEAFDGRFTLIINTGILCVSIIYTYFKYVRKKFINVTITNEEVILRSGKRIPLYDIVHFGIREITNKKASQSNPRRMNGNYYLSSRRMKGKDKIVNRVLHIKTVEGINYNLVESVNSNMMPEEVRNILALKKQMQEKI